MKRKKKRWKIFVDLEKYDAKRQSSPSVDKHFCGPNSDKYPISDSATAVRTVRL